MRQAFSDQNPKWRMTAATVSPGVIGAFAG